MRRFGVELAGVEFVGADSAGVVGLIADTGDIAGAAGATWLTIALTASAAGGITVIFGSTLGVAGEYTGAVNCDISLSGLVNCIGEGLGVAETAGATEGTGVTVSVLLELADFLANWSNSVNDGCPITNCSPMVLMTLSRLLTAVGDS